MRRTCCSSTVGLLSLALVAEVDQFVVGNAAPQEKRQTRGQFQIANAIGFDPTARLAGSFSSRTRNCGLAKMSPKRQLDAVLKRAELAALLVKAHQRFEILAQLWAADRRAAPASKIICFAHVSSLLALQRSPPLPAVHVQLQGPTRQDLVILRESTGRWAVNGP